jgi:hypothetical protein
VLYPVFFGTLLAAVGHSGAAAAVSELASGDGRKSALPANIKTSLLGGRGRGRGYLGGHSVERGAKVVVHGVHAGAVVPRCLVERAALLYLDVVFLCPYRSHDDVPGGNGGS